MAMIREPGSPYGLPSDLRPGTDSYPVRPVGPWAIEKLDYLRGYALIFNRGMKNRWQSRIYLDLFSGPGRNWVRLRSREIEGSPLIAVNCPEPFTSFVFNDLEPISVQALQDRLASLGIQAEYLNYECNDPQLIDKVQALIAPTALSFAFIDPTKWQIRFRTLEALTRNRRMDLLITFHTGSIKRVATRWPQVLDDFFGGSEWRIEYQRAFVSGLRQVSRVLLDLYEKKLHSIGYLDVDDHVLIRNTKSVPLYHLIFASKHRRGLDFWRASTTRDPSGQARLFT